MPNFNGLFFASYVLAGKKIRNIRVKVAKLLSIS